MTIKHTIALALIAGAFTIGSTAQATKPDTVNHPESECSGTFIKSQGPNTGLSVTIAHTGNAWFKIGNQHVPVPVVTQGETYGPGNLSSWPTNSNDKPQEISHVDYCVPDKPPTTEPPTTEPPTTTTEPTSETPTTTQPTSETPTTTEPPTTQPPTTTTVTGCVGWICGPATVNTTTPPVPTTTPEMVCLSNTNPKIRVTDYTIVDGQSWGTHDISGQPCNPTGTTTPTTPTTTPAATPQLPSTGTNSTGWVIALAALLALSGGALIATARRNGFES